MASINIGQSNAGDEFYRYKMPALQSKVRGGWQRKQECSPTAPHSLRASASRREGCDPRMRCCCLAARAAQRSTGVHL